MGPIIGSYKNEFFSTVGYSPLQSYALEILTAEVLGIAVDSDFASQSHLALLGQPPFNAYALETYAKTLFPALKVNPGYTDALLKIGKKYNRIEVIGDTDYFADFDMFKYQFHVWTRNGIATVCSNFESLKIGSFSFGNKYGPEHSKIAMAMIENFHNIMKRGV